MTTSSNTLMLGTSAGALVVTEPPGHCDTTTAP